MGKLRRASSEKDVVEEIGVFGPAVPVRKKQHVQSAIRAGVDRVVVNERILDRTCDRDAAGAVIPADVISDDRSAVAGVLRDLVSPFIANQQEPAVIVVAVVVLNHRVAAVPVGVKALSVPLTFGSVSFVVLDDGIVRAPRPDRNVVVLRTLAG